MQFMTRYTVMFYLSAQEEPEEIFRKKETQQKAASHTTKALEQLKLIS